VSGAFVDLMNEEENVIGQELRKDCHGNPKLSNRAVHVLFNARQQRLLQRSVLAKDIQSWKWDTSVGGHLDSGEDY